jgi:diaminohydroxyphosphoribosylaminopyrimidine deaminase/5-amino-6-(5-phosphoribosylamino)uracil reductase
MSSKKDKFSSKDKNYMRLAMNLAKARIGLTGENPSVGCVIVKNNKIISIGQTNYNGRPHAEYNAIKYSSEDLKGSKMYITLEPCNHYGKTPPCTNQIISKGISEVFYSIDDIDKKVKGKSFKILSKKKIKVHKGLLKKEAKELYHSYFTNRVNKIPFVTGKIAMSKNKLIYSKGNQKITNKSSDKLTHFLRYKNDGILISSKTLNIDNPKLNCRLKGYEKYSPVRIILDKNLEMRLNSNIFKSVKKNNTIIFYNLFDKSKIKIFKKKGFLLIKSRLDSKQNINLRFVLRKLYTLGIRTLLVEGGNKLTSNFLKNKLFDQFYLFESTKNLSKRKDHIIFSSIDTLKSKYNKKSKIITGLVKNNITIYKR